MKPFALLIGLALSGCAAVGADKPPHLTGAWGGPHVGLLLEGGFGTLSYDCASGTVDQVIIPGPDGRFAAAGTHRAGQGGPVRVGQIFTSQRAEYRGSIEGDRMTLSVLLEDGTQLGPFNLDRGQPPQLLRCL